MKTQLKKAVLLSLAAGAMTFGGALGAQAAEEATFALDEMVVTATRTEQKLVDTAANMNVITAEEISTKNYQTVSEALENVPGVSVKRSGFAGGDQHVFLNGDDRVLIMVDGRRLNQDKGTSGRSGFDITNLPSPNFIEKIEILKGAGSSLYGSDAVGGVINIITKSADKNKISLNVNTGSWGTQNYSAFVSAKQGKTGVVVTASKQKQNYVKYNEKDTDKNIKWENSALNSVGATVKIDQEIGDDQLATVYFDHSMKKGGKPYYAANLGGYNTLYPNSKGTDLNNNVSVKYAWGTNKDNNGYVQIYRNHYVGNMYQPSGDANYYETKDGVDIQQNWKLAENNTLTAGAEWRQSKVNNTDSYNGETPKINNKSLFLQDKWNVNDGLSINAGVRYDKHNYFGSETTGSLAINQKLGENSHVYMNWGRVFNAPQGNDLFYVDPWGYMMGNKDLKPETGNVFTLGYDTVIAEKTTFSVNGFYSKLKDAIKWAPTDASGWYWSVMNVAEQKKCGFELNVKHDINKNLSLKGSYAYVSVKENSGYGYAKDANVAPNQYKFDIDYHTKKFNVDLIARGASGLSSASYVDSKYLTMDVSMQYKVKDNWKVYLKGYNLTNAAYAEAGGISGAKYNFPAAGRCFLIGTEFNF